MFSNRIHRRDAAVTETTQRTTEIRALSHGQALLLNHPPLNIITLMSYQDIITIEPGKRGGKPCIRGMRITVYDVLEYLASGMTQEEVLTDFPYLTKEDILACLSYAADREKRLMVVEP